MDREIESGQGGSLFFALGMYLWYDGATDMALVWLWSFYEISVGVFD
jgi:hypothetical protein